MGKILCLQEAEGLLLAMRNRHYERKDGSYELHQAHAYAAVAQAEAAERQAAALERIAAALEAVNERQQWKMDAAIQARDQGREPERYE